MFCDITLPYLIGMSKPAFQVIHVFQPWAYFGVR